MAMFEIVELKLDGTLLPIESLGQFPDGKAAAGYIPVLAAQFPERKFQPRPVAEQDDWRARELKRFETGEYEPIPWGDRLTPVKDHFAHRAKGNKENVAFTADNASGERDRQSSVHVNNYLNRFYPDLPISERRRLVREYTGFNPAENIKFAQSADEIEEVYTNGPGSCMAHAAEAFAEEIHPARMYFGHGLTVAYLEKNNHITARTVVHLERKIFTAIYGDGDELREALRDLGYRRGQGNDWEGVELTTVYVEGTRWIDGDSDDPDDVEGWCAPYVDFASRARLSDDKQRLIIARTGNIIIQCTGGAGQDSDSYYQRRCPVCSQMKYGERFPYRTEANSLVEACADCTTEKYGYCVASGVTFHDSSQVVTLHDGRRATNHRSYVYRCTVTNEWYLLEEMEFHPHFGRNATPPEIATLSKAA